MKRLKDILKFSRWHIVAYLFILYLLSLNHIIFIVPFIVSFCKLKTKISKRLLLGILFLFTIHFIYQNFPNKEIQGLSIVVEKDDLKSKYIIQRGLKKYELYTNVVLNSGDIIYISEKVISYDNPTIPLGFNYKTYQKSQGVFGKIYTSNINIKYQSKLFKLKDLNFIWFKFFKDQNLFEVGSLSYLFSLSSIHLNFYIILIRKVLIHFDFNEELKDIIICILMIIAYMIGLSFIVYIYFLNYFLSFINKRFDLEWKNLDIKSLTLILLFIRHPYVMYHLGTILYLLISFFSVLMDKEYKKYFYIIFIFLIIPFLAYFNGKIYPIEFLIISMFTSILRYILIPIITLTSLFKSEFLLNQFGSFFYDIYIKIPTKLLGFYFPKLNIIWFTFYILFIIYVLVSKNKKSLFKRSLSFLFIFIMFIGYTLIPKSDKVIFLDVGQGEGAVIFKNEKVIVVDAYQNVKSYLMSKYIYDIDYLILTHSDYDHIKEAYDLIDSFNIHLIFLSYYDNYAIKHDCIQYIYEDYLPYIDEIHLEFLGPLRKYDKKNNNSIVFKINVNNEYFLFTGDIEKEAERDLVYKYQNYLKSDILKSPHHGSDTSSSIEFISYVSPNYVVISVGRKNQHNLPSQKVVDIYRISGIKIYLTSNDGSIEFQDNKIMTFPP